MVITGSAQRSNVSFSLRQYRDQNGNIITLSCQNSSHLNDARAMFFLNNTLLSPQTYAGFFDYSNSVGSVKFLIRPQLEGLYSCGVGELRSDGHPIIGKQS